MKNKFDNLANPIFILSLFILLFNDFYLKETFGNYFTGKLSDFAGLLAFPYFFSCILPRYKKTIHIATIFIFIWWKSSFSQSFIDYVNVMNIPIGRVRDFSDNMALISVAVSYFLCTKFTPINLSKRINLVFKGCIISISLFSFIATSLPRKTAIEFESVDKEYTFNMSREHFIKRFNYLQEKEIIDKFKNIVSFDKSTGVLYSDNNDTIVYVIDINKYKDSDTIKIDNYFSHIQIYSQNDSTVLKLINVATLVSEPRKGNDSLTYIPLYGNSTQNLPKAQYRYGYPNIVDGFIRNSDNKKWRKKAIKEFEKRIINKIKKVDLEKIDIDKN